MANLKKTVIVRALNTAKISGAGGKYFDEQFQKHARKALQAAGFFPPVEGKAKYGIGGFVKDYKREDQKVYVQLSCHAEEGDNIKQDWGMTTSQGTVPDIKNEKDFLWALNGLAEGFAPKVVEKYKGYFN